MQTQQQSRNGNTQPPRGVQGRPEVRAREKFGEERVIEIFNDNKVQIEGLLANEQNREAAFLRAQSLAVAAYRKAQADSEVRIDEMSMCATCIWALRQKLDVGTEVWPVPYAGKITPIVSPDGMITLIMRSGLVVAVNYSAVFDGDEFSYVLGTTNKIEHRKTGKRPRAIMQSGRVQENKPLWEALSGAWCVIDLKNGGQIVVVFNKEDLEYFRSLSPFGKSSSSPWAKYGDAMSEIRALKRAAKRAPKSTELSAILLSSEDSDGVEIPDEIMQAVGARMLRDMTGEGNAPNATSGNGEAAPPAAPTPATPAAQRGTRSAQVPQSGDPTATYMPGKAPQPKVAEAENDLLIDVENKMRAAFDDGKWPDQWRERNITQLATIRAEMRHRNLAVPYHAFFDGAQQQQEPEQDFGYDGGDAREPGMEG